MRIEPGKEYYLLDFADRVPTAFARVKVTRQSKTKRGWDLIAIETWIDRFGDYHPGAESEDYPDRFFFDEARFNSLNSVYKHRFIRRCFGIEGVKRDRRRR